MHYTCLVRSSRLFKQLHRMPSCILLSITYTTANYSHCNNPRHVIVPSSLAVSSSHQHQMHFSSNGVSDFTHTRDDPPPYYLTPQCYYIGQDTSIDHKEKRDEKGSINIGSSLPLAASSSQDRTIASYDATTEEKRTIRCGFINLSTRCAIIGLLLSILMLAGGASTVTGSALLSNQCDSDCSGDPNVNQRCSTVCSHSLQKGLLITGILIIIFAAISITVHFVVLLVIPFRRWKKNREQHQTIHPTYS